MAWSPRALVGLARLIREWQPDVVHVHSQEAGLVARPLARLAGARRVFYTPQTIDIRRTRWAWLYRLCERVLARFTHRILSVNEADRQRLVGWGIPPDKVVTIPNGIDLAGFGESGSVEHLHLTSDLDPERPLILQVGRLSTQKDPLSFVEGAALVLNEHPDVQFALAGEGPLKGMVAARIQELELEQHMVLLGWRERASHLMLAADIVTLTSRWEGAPYALLEAMAYSRPVVATAVNGCPEIVADGRTGFLVPPGQPAAWARAVGGLLDDPPLAEAMGREGRQRVEARFSSTEMIDRIEALYKKAG
jgi:glycosyltransferase involved in cell wall biosynthesis